MHRPSLRPALAALLLAGALHADTLRVPQDFVSIQGAVDAAEPGDEVLISPGTYTENVVVQEHVGPLTLRAKGKVLLRAPGGSGTALNFGLVNGVLVDGLRIEDADVGVGVGQCADVELRDLRLADIATHAILVSASQRVSVRDTRVDDAHTGVFLQSHNVVSLHGLDLRDVTEGVNASNAGSVLSVAACRMKGRGDGTGTAFEITDSALEVQLRDNRVAGFGTGVHVEGNSISVIGNTISDCAVGMIVGATGSTQLIQVVDNRVSKIDGIGLSLLGNLMLVRGNRVSKAGTGISTHPNESGSLLHDNRVTASQGVGLALNGNSNALAGNVIKGSGDVDVELSGANNQFQRDEPLETEHVLRVPQDFATIQQALNAAEDGVTVLVSAGTYVEALGLSDASGVTLRGKGKVVLTNPGGTALALEDCTDILLDALRFDDAVTALRLESCAGVSLLDARFEDVEVGVRAEGSSAVFVSDSRFERVELAVHFPNGSHSVVEGCRVDGDASVTKPVGVFAPDITNLSVTGNALRDLDVGISGGDRNMSVDDNRVWNCSGGIVVESEGGLVHANRVVKCGRGVHTTNSGAGDAQVVGNRVIGSAMRGMLLGAPRAIIADNLVKGSGSHGLQHTSVQTILVTANRMLANALDGLETQGAQNSLFAGNKAAKNKGLDLRGTDFDNNAFHANALKTTNLDL